MSSAAKSFNICRLSYLHNYFDSLTKLFSGLYLAKFLDISEKLFFSYDIINILIEYTFLFMIFINTKSNMYTYVFIYILFYLFYPYILSIYFIPHHIYPSTYRNKSFRRYRLWIKIINFAATKSLRI